MKMGLICKCKGEYMYVSWMSRYCMQSEFEMGTMNVCYGWKGCYVQCMVMDNENVCKCMYINNEFENGHERGCMCECMCICNVCVNGLWNGIEMVDVNGNE